MSHDNGAGALPSSPGESPRALKEPFHYSRRDIVRTGIVVTLVAALCVWVSFRFLDPIPPHRIVIASGPTSGLYHHFAERYKKALAAEGVILEERMTDGAAENYRLLLDPKSGVDLAFLQGGMAAFPEAEQLAMVASLYYEPMWIFTRRGEAADALSAFAGRRIALGSAGSGTNLLATQLLRMSGVTAENSTLLPLPTSRSLAALKAGEIDVAMIVTGPRGAALHAALTDPALELVNLAQADAYPQRLTFITRRTLHAGAVEFVPLTPPRDTALIATKAMLVARDTVHPAIVNLLLEVIRDVHKDQGFFEMPNEFPNTDLVDIRVSPDAARHHFARAIEISHDTRPSPYVTLAQSVSVQSQDRAEFVRLLERALTFDPDRDPNQRLATVVLQRKAKALLEHQDDFFLDDASPDTTTTQENR